MGSDVFVIQSDAADPVAVNDRVRVRYCIGSCEDSASCTMTSGSEQVTVRFALGDAVAPENAGALRDQQA